jgi:hypothetical protein
MQKNMVAAMATICPFAAGRMHCVAKDPMEAGLD